MNAFPARTNVVDAPSSFVGRTRELGSLSRLLEQSNVVTIVGPPGTGKTRLALEHATRHLDEYEGGVWWCDLTEARSVEDLHAALGRALEVPIPSVVDDASAVFLLGSALRARGRAVVVFDDFERIVAVAHETIAAWADAAPEAKLLVTSRQAMQLPRERVLELGPFDSNASDGVELFVERARRAWPRYSPNDEDLASIAILVRELDFLPLAIELAAARIRTFSPRKVLESLDRRFEILAEPRSDRPVSLLDAIRSSWESLDESERATLAACTVFRGGFSWDAVESMLEVAAVQSLVEKSLLVATDVRGTKRLSMLLSIRDFAARRLCERGEEAKWIERHTRWFVTEGEARFRASEGSLADEAERWLTLETENLLAVHRRALETRPKTLESVTIALRAAIALGPSFLQNGPCGAYLRILDAALSEASGLPLSAGLRLAAAYERAAALDALGRRTDAQSTLEEGLALAREVADRRMEGRFVAALSHHWTSRGLDESNAYFERAFPILRETDDRFALGRALVFASLVQCHRHEPERARASREEGVAIMRGLGHRFMVCLGTTFGGVLELQMARLPEARAFLEEALELHGAKGDRLEGYALGVLAVVRQEQGAFEEARTSYERALRIHRQTGSARHERGDRIFLATCLHEMGDLDGARRNLEEARAIRPADDRLEALALACLSVLAATEDDVVRARGHMEQAEAMLGGLGASRAFARPIELHRGHIDLALARAARAAGDVAGLEAHRRAALERFEENEAVARGSDEGRFASRMLRRALEELDVPTRKAPRSPSGEDALVVAPNARWFRPPFGEWVDLGGRTALRNLLEVLAERRISKPGRPLSVDELARAAWPAESVEAKRVYTSIARLRKLGLSEVLRRHDDGYLLDPTVPLVRAEKAR